MRNIIPANAYLVPNNAERVFKGVIYEVYQWQQQMYDGSHATFEMLKRPDTIKVLAIKDNKIVILEQEQPGHKIFFDLPGGRHDVESEDELEAAKREMLEETGMTFKTWKLLEAHQPHTKIEQFVYIFLATDFISQIDQNLDAGEKIKIHLMDYKTVKQLVNNPKARYLPKQLLDKADTIEDLLQMEEFKGQN